jgi:hypothetical protein
VAQGRGGVPAADRQRDEKPPVAAARNRGKENIRLAGPYSGWKKKYFDKFFERRKYFPVYHM